MEGGVTSKKIPAIFAVVLLLVFVSAGSASATTCTDVQASIQPCTGAMNGLLLAPPLGCCNGLKLVLDLEKELGVDAACKCFKSIPGVNVNFKVSTDIQNLCKIKLGFSLATNETCS